MMGGIFSVYMQSGRTEHEYERFVGTEHTEEIAFGSKHEATEKRVVSKTTVDYSFERAFQTNRCVAKAVVDGGRNKAPAILSWGLQPIWDKNVKGVVSVDAKKRLEETFLQLRRLEASAPLPTAAAMVPVHRATAWASSVNPVDPLTFWDGTVCYCDVVFGGMFRTVPARVGFFALGLSNPE